MAEGGGLFPQLAVTSGAYFKESLEQSLKREFTQDAAALLLETGFEYLLQKDAFAFFRKPK
ncbi:MAG: hypothetical protein ACLFU9_03105 [Candidatus Bathyarchaeia archaeon]